MPFGLRAVRTWPCSVPFLLLLYGLVPEGYKLFVGTGDIRFEGVGDHNHDEPDPRNDARGEELHLDPRRG